MQNTGGRKAGERRLRGRLRHIEALKLKLAGATYDDIAGQLGYASRSGAHKGVMLALKREAKIPAAELRKVEDMRLDRALLAIWQRVMAGDDGAIDRFIKIAARRAALLGLDEPSKAEIGNIGGIPFQVKTTHNDVELAHKIAAILATGGEEPT